MKFKVGELHRRSATSSFVAAAVAIAIAVMAVMPHPAHAEKATHCVIVQSREGGGQQLVNICDAELEVTWCLFSENNCRAYNNTWTIGPRASYPIADGSVLYAACRGKNSIKRREGMIVECE